MLQAGGCDSSGGRGVGGKGRLIQGRMEYIRTLGQQNKHCEAEEGRLGSELLQLVGFHDG